MTIMLTKQSSIFFLVLFAIISFSTIAIVHQSDEFFSRYISPLSIGCKRQKLSHLYFYFHDTVFDKNAIVIRIAEAPSTNSSSSFFRAEIMDDPLMIKPDVNSKMVGRAQGIYAFASQTNFSLGSTFSVLGRNKVVSTMREMSIVGGIRVFRLAHGYVEARTHTFDLKTCNVVVECNVYVSIIELQVLHFQDNI
ncbi:hypothetical protein SCA6_002394 [Theobroma cacao]